MIEYFISKEGDTYLVAKFDGGDIPCATYTVKGKSCDCPAGSHRGTCKHIKMVMEWRPGFYYAGGSPVLLPLPESFK